MSFMFAVDTNILVYAFTKAYPEKRSIARSIVEDIFLGKNKGVVTNQILAEFSIIMTRKMEKPLSKSETRTIIGAIMSSENWHVFNYNGDTVLRALDTTQSFWDALIAETLKENNIQKIITENEKHFKESGLLVRNPFVQ